MNLTKVVMVTVLASSASAFAADGCDMTKAMQAAQTAERQRRSDDIDARVQQIRSANDAYNSCLDNFPGYPTQLPNSEIFLKAYQNIKSNSCQALISKAQQVGQTVTSTIDNKTGNASRDIDKALGNAGLSSSDVTKAVSGSSSTSVVDTLKGLFQ